MDCDARDSGVEDIFNRICYLLMRVAIGTFISAVGRPLLGTGAGPLTCGTGAAGSFLLRNERGPQHEKVEVKVGESAGLRSQKV